MEEKEIVTEESKEEKKSGGNKVLIVIIVVLLLIIAVGFGYFLGNGALNSDEKEDDKVVDETPKKEEAKDNNENKEEIEQLTKDSVVVKELFEIFREDNYAKNQVWSSDYTDFENKMYIAFLSLKESELKTVKCGTLNATYAFDKTNFIYHCGVDFSDKAGRYYADNDWVNFGKELVNNTVMTVSAQKLRSTYEKLFGINSTYSDETLSLSYNTLLYYDKAADVYAKFSCQCGGEVGDMTHTLDSIVQENTSLVLKTTLIAEKTIKINYTFDYEKETGNYIFVSRTVV